MAAATAMAAVATSMASLSIKASSSVKDFSGLSSATSFACRLPAAAAAPSRSAGLLQAPLRIEARNPTRRESTKVRHRRIRKKLNGTSERPRLAVYRSNKHIYAQVIDDTISSTLAAASTAQKALRQELELSAGPTIEAAKRVGAEIAKACAEKGISKVAFDRGGFIYHGRIQALADAARENGLDF